MKGTRNKKKIINDPVYGFITLPYNIIFDLIEQPEFQRLRRIKQLGLAHLVYPGALHTRFHHALGALHLMVKALNLLENKGVEISVKEKKGACIAILLHDIGHGPFSHTLEHSIIPGVSHEQISLHLMYTLNQRFEGALQTGIEIFENKYHRPFLHQLISGQLDMDRLDYLGRDSFYTGVSEGIVGSERIINMLNVKDDALVVEEKGIYSIEKFIVARRLMYWQVYLHKTSISADHILIQIFKRAKELANMGEELAGSPALKFFLYRDQFDLKSPDWIDQFTLLDDSDVMVSLKYWMQSKDLVLATLCKQLVNRKLPQISIRNHAYTQKEVEEKQQEFIQNNPQIPTNLAHYFIYTSEVSNEAYAKHHLIKIMMKSGELLDLTEASDNYNITALQENVKKYFLSTPKEMILLQES